MTNRTESRRFTVVIPTRERCDTLVHALHTCVIQDYDNLEILVSDNFSQDRTRDVIESYKDTRIRYINTGKRLSMTDNYEFALSHIKPEGYVLYIGDDDGLLPNAIHDINNVVHETGARVLRWDLPTYAWPTLGNSYANQLHIPSLNAGTTVRDSAATIQQVLTIKAPHEYLPLMYLCSAVHYELIKKIKNISGRFYNSYTPDVYSGFAIAGAAGSFVNSRRPYAICGASHNSIGASASCSSMSSAAVQKYFSEDNLPYHTSLVFSRSLPACIVESFLQARDHLPFFQEVTPDMQQLLFRMMEEAAQKSQDFYNEIKDAVEQIGRMHNMQDAAQRAVAANPKREPGSVSTFTSSNPARTGFSIVRRILGDLYRGRVVLDCSSLNVRNIYDACLLCDHILRLGDLHIIGLAAVLKFSLANIKRMITEDVQNAKR